MSRLSRALPVVLIAVLALVGAASTTPPDPPDDIDMDGFDENSDCHDNDATIFPGAPDTPGDGVDQNGDGVDGDQTHAVFVSATTGADSAMCGDIASPCGSITQGRVRSTATGQSEILVAGGAAGSTPVGFPSYSGGSQGPGGAPVGRRSQAVRLSHRATVFGAVTMPSCPASIRS